MSPAQARVARREGEQAWWSWVCRLVPSGTLMTQLATWLEIGTIEEAWHELRYRRRAR